MVAVCRARLSETVLCKRSGPTPVVRLPMQALICVIARMTMRDLDSMGWLQSDEPWKPPGLRQDLQT